MKPLHPKAQAYWEAYRASLGFPPELETCPVEALMAGNREVTDGLIALYLSGKKTAGSGLLEDYLAVGDPLPVPGRHWIVLNSKGEPACILRTVKVTRCKFKDATEEIALAEGEGDCSLAAWREIHVRFFTPYLAQWGVNDLEEATLVTEYFQLVHR